MDALVPRRGRVASVFAVSLLAVVILIMAGARQARSASDSEWGYSWGKTTAKCIEVEVGKEVEKHTLVYAHVTSSMAVRNRGIGAHWVTNFRLKARLIPTTTSANWTRSWKTKRFPVHSNLLQDYDYSKSMAVNTDTYDPEEDWNVDVKQVWDRDIPWHDIVRHFEFPFDTGSCRKGKLPVNSGGDGVSLGRTR
jgi:hypothetical protein